VVFSSPIFLFLFLPIVLAGYFVTRGRLCNLWLLGMSLVFYGWGEPRFVVVMLASIAANFGFGLWLDRIRGRPGARAVLAVAIALNLGLLVLYKYAAFLAGNASAALALIGAGPVQIPAFVLPLGISFYTFHALSYLVDVSRRAADGQRDPAAMGLYIVFFPQLIAGPIIRYHYIADQLVQRVVTREGFAQGVERFVIGLGKKMLVANTVAVPADAIFALPTSELTPGLAWLGIVCYTLQIYFDFSGYSDMAIGLARLFGFRFPENFNYPYIARSMTEFWRRWHISLSTWFRDYLYVPLGGNRHGSARTYLNLWLVFFLCGLWHGAAWTFVAWGLYHGSFLVLERLGLGRRLESLWTPARHAYTILAVMVGWVFFRSETLQQAGSFLSAMAGFASGSGLEQHVGLHLNAMVAVALAAGVLGSAPLLPWLAMMMLGWSFGRVLARSDRPEGLLAAGGAAALVLFALVRGLNGYGNMRLLSEDGSLVQWLHVSKYPPSLAYTALELGLMALCLAALFSLGRRVPAAARWLRPLLVLGQTALFFYLLHVHVLTLAAWALGASHHGGLAVTYAAGAGIVLLLYPLCARYRRYKLAHPDGWARYV